MDPRIDSAIVVDPADLPGPDVICPRTLESRRQFGIEPRSREHVERLVKEWNRFILDGASDATTRH
jgi:hypothetical protein